MTACNLHITLFSQYVPKEPLEGQIFSNTNSNVVFYVSRARAGSVNPEAKQAVDAIDKMLSIASGTVVDFNDASWLSSEFCF